MSGADDMMTVFTDTHESDRCITRSLGSLSVALRCHLASSSTGEFGRRTTPGGRRVYQSSANSEAFNRCISLGSFCQLPVSSGMLDFWASGGSKIWCVKCTPIFEVHICSRQRNP